MTLNTTFNSLQASTKRVYKQAQKKSFTTTGETMWVFFQLYGKYDAKGKVNSCPILVIAVTICNGFRQPLLKRFKSFFDKGLSGN